MAFDPQPVLIGEIIELRPLRPDDFDDLYAVAADPLVWAQHPDPRRHDRERFRAFFDDAVASGGALVAVDRATRRVIGSSRFDGYDQDAGRDAGPEAGQAAGEVEIGWTFLARSHWGGVYNGEMKRLMLEHAFRFVDRVVFLIGLDNRRSQRAAEKIGAVRVGARPDDSGHESHVYEITAAAFDDRPPHKMR